LIESRKLIITELWQIQIYRMMYGSNNPYNHDEVYNKRKVASLYEVYTKRKIASLYLNQLI